MAELIQTQNDLSKKSKSFKKVFNHDQSEIMNVQLKEGEGMPEHDAKHSIMIIVRSGEVQFDCSGDRYILSDSDILFLEAREKHSVKAVQDTDFLIVFIK